MRVPAQKDKYYHTPLEHILLSKPEPLAVRKDVIGMKTKQNPTGTSRQKSIKQLAALRPTASKNDEPRLVVAPGLMAAIKSHVRPAAGQ